MSRDVFLNAIRTLSDVSTVRYFIRFTFYSVSTFDNFRVSSRPSTKLAIRRQNWHSLSRYKLMRTWKQRTQLQFTLHTRVISLYRRQHLCVCPSVCLSIYASARKSSWNG